MASILNRIWSQADFWDKKENQQQRQQFAQQAAQQKARQQQQPQPQQQSGGWNIGRVVHDVTHNPVTNDIGNAVQTVARPVFNAPQTINNDVFKPIQRDVFRPAVNFASRSIDQANPFDNGRTWQQRTPVAAHNGNIFQQATHNGLTNVTGSFAKGLAGMTGVPAAIDTTRLVAGELTHNQPTIDNATVNLSRSLPQFLPIAAAEGARTALTPVAQAIAAPYAEHVANQEANRARKELTLPGATPAYKAAVNAYSSAVKTDNLNNYLNQAGIDMNTPTSQVAKQVAGQMYGGAAEAALAGKMGLTMAPKKALAQLGIKKAVASSAVKEGLQEWGPLGAISAAGMTATNPNASNLDIIKAGALGYGLNAGIPIALRAPAVARAQFEAPGLTKTQLEKRNSLVVGFNKATDQGRNDLADYFAQEIRKIDQAAKSPVQRAIDKRIPTASADGPRPYGTGQSGQVPRRTSNPQSTQDALNTSLDSSVDPLAALKQEALKYKSADEFVQKNPEAAKQLNAHYQDRLNQARNVTKNFANSLAKARQILDKPSDPYYFDYNGRKATITKLQDLRRYGGDIMAEINVLHGSKTRNERLFNDQIFKLKPHGNIRQHKEASGMVDHFVQNPDMERLFKNIPDELKNGDIHPGNLPNASRINKLVTERQLNENLARLQGTSNADSSSVLRGSGADNVARPDSATPNAQNVTDLFNQAHAEAKPTDPTAALKAEALKYKSADEFVNATHDTFYKGLSKDGKRVSSEYGDGYYVTKNKDFAKMYDKGGGIQESYLKQDSKIISSNDPAYKAVKAHYMEQVPGGEPGYRKPNLDKVNIELRKHGYDAVMVDSPKGDNISTVILNKEALKTKQQLTDLYNQAHAEAKTAVKMTQTDPMQRVFDQNPMSKGIILKDGPVVGGKQDVIVARRNPQTGHLEARQESRPAPNVQKMSDAEFASLARRVDQEAQVHADELPPQKQLQGKQSPVKSPYEKNVSSPNISRPLDSVSQIKSQLSDTRNTLEQSRTANTENFSSADNIPPEAQGHNGYPVGKKVNILDYIRTPEKVLNKFGLHDEAQALLKADHHYKQTLPKEIDRISKWNDEIKKNPESSQRIFKKLDGQKVALNPTETKVAGEIKQYLKDWADRLGLPEDKRLSNYITHIFDKELVAKEFDPELAKLIDDKTAKSVYDPFTQQRLGAKGYKEDVIQALDAYVKRGVRKEAFDPALAKLESASQDLELESQKFVKRYTDRINMRPMEIDNLIDNFVKQSPVGYKLGQRPVAAISRGIRQATFRATLGGNIGSAVRNLTQGVNTFAELGSRWTGVGYVKAVAAMRNGGEELKRNGVLDNSYIEDRSISAAKKTLEKLDKGLFVFFDSAERINRGAAYFGAKSKALAEGKTEAEAIKAGVETARKTQFTFGKVDTPVMLQGDLAKLVTQFQSYNVKQAEFLAEMVKNKEFAKLLRFTGASAAVYLTVGKALGYKPADMIPFGGNVTNSQSPFAGTPAFKVGGDIIRVGQAAIKSPTTKTTRLQATQKALGKLGSDVGSATIPGFVQGKKTVTGIQAVNAGEVKKGNKKYLLDKNKPNYIKGAVFGAYSLNGLPASNRVTFDGVPTTLTNKQKSELDTMVKNKERVMSQQMQNDPAFKALTPDQQRSKISTLSKQVTTAEKRVFAAKYELGQYNQNYTGKQTRANKTIQNIIDGKYKPKISQTTGSSTSSDSTPREKYTAALATYNSKKSTMTDVQRYAAEKGLAKMKVQAPFSNDVLKLYGMSKADAYNYLTTKTKGVDKKKLSEQLIAYDKALHAAGFSSYLKYKTGIAPAAKGGSRSGGKGGSKAKYSAAAAASFRAAMHKQPLKVVGALPAPTKLATPSFKTTGLRTVYKKKAVNTRPASSLTKTRTA